MIAILTPFSECVLLIKRNSPLSMYDLFVCSVWPLLSPRPHVDEWDSGWWDSSDGHALAVCQGADPLAVVGFATLSLSAALSSAA